MNIVYTVCFSAFFSCGTTLYTQELVKNVHVAKDRTQDPYTYPTKNYKIDPNNIAVRTSTNWTSGLNITGISLNDDPKEQLTLFFDVSTFYRIPGDAKTLDMHKIQNINLYEIKERHIYNEKSLNWTENHIIIKNITLGILQSIQSDIHFRNLDTPSKIYYNTSFSTEINITFPSNMSKIEMYEKFAELEETLEIPVTQIPGLYPLGNSTGQDMSICSNLTCTSDSDVTIIFESLLLPNNIEARSLKRTGSEVSAYKWNPKEGYIMYSRKSRIFANYIISLNNASDFITV